ncbi:MAG: hypothetical protein AAB403_11135 [Planctomycetota bacterium]
MQLANVVTVAPRFTRAVNLERDIASQGAVEGYVVTSTAQSVLDRLVRTFKAAAGQRAWTLTGPYGSGKSAFALFLANLLGPGGSPGGRIARSILRAQTPELYQAFFDRRTKVSLALGGFCPVLVSGTADPLIGALLRACCRDIRRYYTHGRPPDALKTLEDLHTEFEVGHSVSPSDAVEALASLALRLQASGRSQGIMLIVDELGKFLEFSAREPERGDIYVLQQLAEATARFDAPGFVLVTILHQSFDRYAAELRPAVRDEWSKVQGRFEDVAYQEPPEELLHLVASAIGHRDHPLMPALQHKARQLAQRAADLGLVPPGLAKRDFVEAMARCAPLHPLVVLALVRLCRKFGQNQRSLFAFLVSREPHGFSNFLLEDFGSGEIPFYRLPDLYDYVSEALGNGLSVGENATRWAEVQGALDRCAASPAEELDIIKVVGVLAGVGGYGGLKPAREVVEFALAGHRSTTRQRLQGLLDRSVLVYRKYNQAFALWQGSDIDLDGREKEAEKRVTEAVSVARKISALWTPQPLVAKRHSFQTGTLRYFAVRFTDVAGFSKTLEPDGDADGSLVYGLPNSRGDVEELVGLARSSAVRDRIDVLVAIPREVEGLREAARQLELLLWVAENTPELQGDGVARRELRSRTVVAEARVAREIRALFSPGELTARNTEWYHRGLPRPISSVRSLAHLLSDICDAVYPCTPRVRNELVNRRTLSSAAAAGRRNLIDAMIVRGTEERLGIVGTPPEMSMYASVLAAPKIHRRDAVGWAFGPPESDPNLLEVWKAIERFFAGCELQRRPVPELFSLLQKPPFGLKMGVIPVIFCAAVLAHDAEVALYENGAFIPELGVELFERLLRSPEKFALRRYQVVGVRREVFQQFARLLGAALQSEGDHLVAVVRPLYRFFNRLPQYCRQTKNVSETAVAVRNALVNARDPDTLLFEDLPRACGVDPFPPTDVDPGRVSEFFRLLQHALAELQRAYDDLLSELQQLLFRALGATGSGARQAISFRAQAVAEHAVDVRLRGFIHHLAEEEFDDVAWIEAIATMLEGKAPRTWSDSDRARYEVAVTESVRSFRHMEALVFELLHQVQAGREPSEVLRIGVTDRHSAEKEAVVIVEAADKCRLAEAVLAVEECFERLGIAAAPHVALAALATVSRRFLTDLEEPEKWRSDARREAVKHG